MEFDIPTIKIGELASSISITHNFDKGKLIFLNTSDILLGKILHRNYSEVKDWPGQAKKSIQINDILFSEIRPSNGRWAFVNEVAEDFVVSTKLMVIRANNKKILPKFLYHFLTSNEVTNWLQHLAESRSGTFPQITFDQVSSLDIPELSIAAQLQIVQVIDAIDDRIDHNRALAANLEAIARRLFKSWFVDFDPVRAKATGEKPSGLADDIAALFPDRFVESEIGEVPEGWVVGTISDLSDVVGGTTPSTKEPTYWDGGTHAWATPKDLSALLVPILLDTERQITDAGLSQIGSGLLPKGTVLLSSRAPIGYLAIAEVPVAINQGFIAMKPKTGISNIYLLLWASVAYEEIVSRANGSTFLEISKANFRPIPVIKPTTDVMQVFDYLARPLYEKIANCERESRTLTTLRDALLPKLISGEIRVSDAQTQIKESLA